MLSSTKSTYPRKQLRSARRQPTIYNANFVSSFPQRQPLSNLRVRDLNLCGTNVRRHFFVSTLLASPGDDGRADDDEKRGKQRGMVETFDKTVKRLRG